MKKFALVLSFFAFIGQVNAQEVTSSELGFDGTFYASTFGGTFGIGVKYGFNFGEDFIAGPSFRYQRSWTKNGLTQQKAGFNVIGGGAFGHFRFFEALFLGAEFEMLRTPYNSFGALSTQSSWAPTLLIGGGFSKEFDEKFRINAGIMYDVIDNQKSPLKTQYFMRNSQNVLLPVLYRIALFIPLN